MKNVSEVIPYIENGDMKFDHKNKDNESVLYNILSNQTIHPAMYLISFDKKCEMEGVSTKTGQTCLMKAIENYLHPCVIKNRVYQTQVLSIVQQIFFRYEKNILHQDKKGKNLLYYFISTIQNETDMNMVGFIIQHILNEYIEKGFEIEWDMENEEGKSIRYLFLKHQWKRFVYLSPGIKESFYSFDMKKKCNFYIMDQFRDNQELLEICIQSIRNDDEIEVYSFTDDDGNSIIHCMVLMMNSEDEEFVTSLLDDPKFHYFQYDLDKPSHHIIIDAIGNNYFHFALTFLKKMKERSDWKEFISILLDPEVQFYHSLCQHIDQMEIETIQDAIPIMELLEFVFHHDIYKRTIQDIDTNIVLNLCVFKSDEDELEFVNLDFFDRIMNMIDLKTDETYVVTPDIIGFIQNIKNSIQIGFDENDVIKAFSRFFSHLEIKQYYPFLKIIEDMDSLLKIAIQRRSIRRHIGSFISSFKKSTVSCKKIEDECPVCYLALEDQYHSCTTCHQNTHFSCLSVWLENQSQCVMCRSLITNEEKKKIHSFGKIDFYQNLYTKFILKKDS